MTDVVNFGAAGTSMFSEFCGALEMVFFDRGIRNACFLIAVEKMRFWEKACFSKMGISNA
jgi:hypothetical protein